MNPELWIIACPNGAGKTTSIQKGPLAEKLRSIPCLNADALSLVKLQAAGFEGFAQTPSDRLTSFFLEAANEVYAELERMLAHGESVAIETVLSTDKYQPLVESVLARGGRVGLVYVALSSSDLACRRVATRVGLGGHNVPAEKIVSRWHRSLEKLSCSRLASHTFGLWTIQTETLNRDCRCSLQAKPANSNSLPTMRFLS